MKTDFVRRPGHGGKPCSRSRGSPASLPCEKKETDAGEFPPTTNWPNKYVASKPILMTCIHCGRETYMYYSFKGEGFQHQLDCSLCGEPNGPLEDGA